MNRTLKVEKNYQPTNYLRVAQWEDQVMPDFNLATDTFGGPPKPTKTVIRSRLQQKYYCMKTGSEEWRFVDEISISKPKEEENEKSK